jgi:hypothetical protein
MVSAVQAKLTERMTTVFRIHHRRTLGEEIRIELDVRSRKPSVAYVKPFDLLVEGNELEDWLAALDDFCNWLIRTAA